MFSNRPAEALAERISELSPIPDAKVFFTPGGGSDAIDTAAKLARAYWRAAGQPGKQVIIGRSHAYHGVNAYGTSLGGIPANTEAFSPLVAQVERVPWDDAAALEKLIGQVGADRVAAFFCEPVVGAGGILYPPEGYLTRVQEICREQDVLFVADEVICRVRPAGPLVRQRAVRPRSRHDHLAKGLTSGYAPLGAVLVGPRVAEPFWRPGSAEVFRHGYTYQSHPTACAVGLANLDLLEREQLVGRVARAGVGAGRGKFAPLADHQLVGEVRSGTGLLDGGRDWPPRPARPTPGSAPAWSPALASAGVITRLLRGVALQVSPPFVITEAELDRVAEVFADDPGRRVPLLVPPKRTVPQGTSHQETSSQGISSQKPGRHHLGLADVARGEAVQRGMAKSARCRSGCSDHSRFARTTAASPTCRAPGCAGC